MAGKILTWKNMLNQQNKKQKKTHMHTLFLLFIVDGFGSIEMYAAAYRDASISM